MHMPDALDAYAEQTHPSGKNASADWSRRVLNGSPCISSACIAYVHIHVDFVWFKAHLCRQHYTYIRAYGQPLRIHSLTSTNASHTNKAGSMCTVQLGQTDTLLHSIFDLINCIHIDITLLRTVRAFVPIICRTQYRGNHVQQNTIRSFFYSSSFSRSSVWSDFFSVKSCGLLIQFVVVVSTVFVIVVVVGVFCISLWMALDQQC